MILSLNMSSLDDIKKWASTKKETQQSSKLPLIIIGVIVVCVLVYMFFPKGESEQEEDLNEEVYVDPDTGEIVPVTKVIGHKIISVTPSMF
mgnify:CR=1 FL=1